MDFDEAVSLVTQRFNIPGPQVPALQGMRHVFSDIWYLFLSSIVNPPSAYLAVTPGASPFKYTAPEDGNLIVSGGNVSAITLTRSGTVIPTGATAGPIPMAKNDLATITYTVAPTLNYAGN